MIVIQQLVLDAALHSIQYFVLAQLFSRRRRFGRLLACAEEQEVCLAVTAEEAAHLTAAAGGQGGELPVLKDALERLRAALLVLRPEVTRGSAGDASDVAVMVMMMMIVMMKVVEIIRRFFRLAKGAQRRRVMTSVLWLVKRRRGRRRKSANEVTACCSVKRLAYHPARPADLLFLRAA